MRVVNKNIHCCIYSCDANQNESHELLPKIVLYHLVCAVAMGGVFLLQRSFPATILATTRLIWMGTYCTSNGPVKLTKETFHCCCDMPNILHKRLWKSLGMGVLFGESKAGHGSSFWRKHRKRSCFMFNKNRSLRLVISGNSIYIVTFIY